MRPPFVESLDNPDAATWVSLREAERATGVRVATLRKWVYKGAVESPMRDGPYGAQRVVRVADVLARKAASDRLMSAEPARTMSPMGKVPTATVVADRVLVPLDAWMRMFDQVESLQEAAFALAAARERAAKAEATVDFLREQVREARAEQIAGEGIGRESEPATKSGRLPWPWGRG